MKQRRALKKINTETNPKHAPESIRLSSLHRMDTDFIG